jgi:dihydrofolate reductase
VSNCGDKAPKRRRPHRDQRGRLQRAPRWCVEFVNDAIGPFVSRLREQPGKDIWLMGGGELIASFLDEHAIDEFVVSVAPVFIGMAFH